MTGSVVACWKRDDWPGALYEVWIGTIMVMKGALELLAHEPGGLTVAARRKSHQTTV